MSYPVVYITLPDPEVDCSRSSSACSSYSSTAGPHSSPGSARKMNTELPTIFQYISSQDEEEDARTHKGEGRRTPRQPGSRGKSRHSPRSRDTSFEFPHVQKQQQQPAVQQPELHTSREAQQAGRPRSHSCPISQKAAGAMQQKQRQMIDQLASCSASEGYPRIVDKLLPPSPFEAMGQRIKSSHRSVGASQLKPPSKVAAPATPPKAQVVDDIAVVQKAKVTEHVEKAKWYTPLLRCFTGKA